MGAKFEAARSALIGEPVIEEIAAREADEARDRMEFVAMLAVFCAGILTGVVGVFLAAAVS